MRVLGLTLLSVACFSQTSPTPDEAARTILDRNCAGCHGATQMSGLDLRQREAALKGGSRGPAIVPGKPAESLLFKALLRDGDVKMPPGKKGLDPADIDTIRAWIERGANWTAAKSNAEPSWWSFKKLKRPDVPKLATAATPVDAFILAKLAGKNLRPVPLADRRTLDGGAGGGGGNRNGRDHNPYGFSVWLAGGGIKGGKTIGATDEIGLMATENKVTMHDLHATLLSLLGMDHKRLTFPFQGREFRLTDVGGDGNFVTCLTND